MKARLAKKNELAKIIRWAKNPLNKKVNFWQLKSKDPEYKILIIESSEREAIGVVIYDTGGLEVSIFMVPGWHYKRKGVWVLLAVERWAKRYYPFNNYLWAETGNPAAERIFYRAGYRHNAALGEWYKNI